MHFSTQSSKGCGDEEVLCPAGEVEEDDAEFPKAAGTRQSDEQEEEVREVQSPTTPVTPTLEEVRQLRLTHTPFSILVSSLCEGKGQGESPCKVEAERRFHGHPKTSKRLLFCRAPTAQWERGESS